MYTQYNQMVAELGMERVMDIVNKYQSNMEYRKAYGKRKAQTERAIVKAFKAGELTFGGTRVEMSAPVEQDQN
jgi:hypothetical protein